MHRSLTRNYAYDVTLTLRTSIGLSLQEYITAIGKIESRELKLASISSDQSICVIYTQDEKLN